MKTKLLVLIFVPAFVSAYGQADKTDCADHPAISRYPGALIEYCDVRNFSEYSIAIGPETGYRTIEDWIKVSGKQTRIYYSIKGDKIVSEVYQNYLTAFQKSGFTLLANKMHQERNVAKEVGGGAWLGTFYRANPFPTNVGIKINTGSGTMGGTFFVAAQKGNTYMAVAGKRYSENETVVLLDVVETAEMVDDLISVNAEYISDKIFAEGKVALDGILFDHNQATIKDESKPLLLEIARFLQQYPSTKIFVVGHTDMTGEIQYNIDLSGRRATAVVEYLKTNHQISASRLLPYGVGPLSPLASNLDEPGKAKNRRVELVLQSK